MNSSVCCCFSSISSFFFLSSHSLWIQSCSWEEEEDIFVCVMISNNWQTGMAPVLLDQYVESLPLSLPDMGDSFETPAQNDFLAGGGGGREGRAEQRRRKRERERERDCDRVWTGKNKCCYQD